jgi:hypothetical protein
MQGALMLRALLLSLMLAAASSASASGTIYYGSRAGMEVTVVSMEGLDTARAIIRTKHTRDNAIAFCRDYVQKVTEECIRETLAIRLNDVITANCTTGDFVDFRGTRYRFLGPNRKTGDFVMAKFAIMNIATKEIADGSSASGYPTNLGIFEALCPGRGPFDR